MGMKPKGLGRRVPTDFNHYDKYLLTANTVPAKPTPVVLGTLWYSGFDDPIKDEGTGKFWLPSKNIGYVRGGHAYVGKPPALEDYKHWWKWWDQGEEGKCVSMAWTRYAALMNRRMYVFDDVYAKAQARDEWAETPPESGTSVRAGGEVMRTDGPTRKARFKILQPFQKARPDDGISVYRWATSVEQVVEVLGSQDYLNRLGAIPCLNSWGFAYPHIFYMSFELLDRLIREDGEVALATDR